mmetsp:Transcript_8946/g.29597  ORF Transcript_8946/g.29597 Transcript_8946/m.29597 type:complete len:224 (-) Transcript_8946:893-1564(-)
MGEACSWAKGHYPRGAHNLGPGASVRLPDAELLQSHPPCRPGEAIRVCACRGGRGGHPQGLARAHDGATARAPQSCVAVEEHPRLRGPRGPPGGGGGDVRRSPQRPHPRQPAGSARRPAQLERRAKAGGAGSPHGGVRPGRCRGQWRRVHPGDRPDDGRGRGRSCGNKCRRQPARLLRGCGARHIPGHRPHRRGCCPVFARRGQVLTAVARAARPAVARAAQA